METSGQEKEGEKEEEKKEKGEEEQSFMCIVSQSREHLACSVNSEQ